MSANRVLLDVDPTILDRNLMITDPNDDGLSSLFPRQQEDQVPSKLVKPSPGFCIKTRLQSGEKLFINICQTDAIPKPDDISESELVKILESDESSEYRVPMSIGQPRLESDRSGNPATTYDVAINPEFFLKVENSAMFKRFFLTVALEGIQDKYKIEIDVENVAVLKNRKAMGTLQTHRIQQREIDRTIRKVKEPLIQEIGGYEAEPAMKEPKYRLFREPKVGKIECVVGEFHLPGVLSGKDIALDVGEDRIVLEVKSRSLFLDTYVPYSILQDDVDACFDKSSGFLTLKLPIEEQTGRSA